MAHLRRESREGGGQRGQRPDPKAVIVMQAHGYGHGEAWPGRCGR